MNFLIVSDREYKKTSRGIDIITTYLAERNHNIDHLVFFRRKKIPDKQISGNITQKYFFDSIKLYRGKIQFLFPGFLLLFYFRHLIKKQKNLDFKKYDFVILESGHPIYLAGAISNKIIYRQSDPVTICFNSDRSFYKQLEKKVLSKSVFISSALEQRFFPAEYKGKTSHWHSGFVPFNKAEYDNPEKTLVVMGGEMDWVLLNKLAKNHLEYTFHVVGISGILPLRKNIVINGYMSYDNYRNMLSSASAVIIPFSNNYVHHLEQVFYTAKILIAIYLGLPVLLRAYGAIQKTDYPKKIFVYNNHKAAIAMFNEIIDKLENGQIDNSVSEETRDFLLPQTVENRIKQLDDFFNPILKSKETS